MASATARAPTVAVGLMVIGSPITPGRKVAADDPEQHAEGAADQAEHRRLDQELAPDDPWRRAERLAQADLPDALGDRDQHDVHDPDAADEERDAGDAAQQDGQRPVHRGGGRRSATAAR